ncbi:HK97 family phage prohead protease [Rhizobium leguminosarum]|uniref:HK97 family phage prohead protease n=1 Tax=Rhizobium leguminosarum TaxID=384 RepID=UPI001C951DCC|nr:HK97 family phage prohead protease [Rhizobium leguminosarum]MBY5698532.1 HK97 family phage prohead protease [Rhizobium leguminosarum]
MSELEKRIAQQIELRADDGAKTLTGYAAKFNTPTGIADYFVEQIAPGAFSETIKGDVRCLFNHDSDNVLGRTASRTLRLWEDDIGLRFEVDLPDTNLGRDIGKLVERRDISGCSFGFRALKQTWDDTTSPPGRTLEKVEISEISIVTFPAYPDTSVGLRSLEAARADAETAKAAEQRKAENAAAAARRLAEKRAIQEQKFRGI